jgi:hypothetical protein
MGYEVNYNYYEKLKDSFDYDRENLKSFKKIYGKASEEYPLEKLCPAIMQQLARRDILIVDWEVYEFVRKKITCRLTKNDLVIKNKKFSLKNALIEDDMEVEGVEENIAASPCISVPVAPAPQPVNIAPPVAQVVNSNIVPVNVAATSNGLVNVVAPKKDKVIKQVQFLPGRMSKPIGRFTVEKMYPVFAEHFAANGIGMLIETIDDGGARVKVPDEHFVSTQVQLLGDQEAGFSQNSKGFADDKALNWSGVMRDQVPAVR